MKSINHLSSPVICDCSLKPPHISAAQRGGLKPAKRGKLQIMHFNDISNYILERNEHSGCILWHIWDLCRFIHFPWPSKYSWRINNMVLLLASSIHSYLYLAIISTETPNSGWLHLILESFSFCLCQNKLAGRRLMRKSSKLWKVKRAFHWNVI